MSTIAQRLGRVRGRSTTYDRPARRGARQRAPAHPRHARHHASPRARWTRAARSGRYATELGGRPEAPRASAWPSRCPAGSPRWSTARWRTRWTTTTPTCRRSCTRAPRSCRPRSPWREATGRDGARARPRRSPSGLEICVRLGMAGYDREARNYDFFERGQHATSICGTIGAAAGAAVLLGLDAEGIAHAIGIAASMAAGVIEANRTGGTVKRIHCGWAAHAAIGRRPPGRAWDHRPAHRARGPVRLLPGLPATATTTPTAIDAGSASAGRCRASSSSPTRPTTSPTPASTPPWRCARRACRPDDVDALELGVAEPTVRTIGEPIEVKRAPVDRLPGRSSAARTRWWRRCSAAAGSGSGSTTSPTRWPPTRRGDATWPRSP